MSVKSLTPSCSSFRVFDLIRPWSCQRLSEHNTINAAYPGEVELCLHADIIAFFLVLCAQDLKLCWLEWAVTSYLVACGTRRRVHSDRKELFISLKPTSRRPQRLQRLAHAQAEAGKPFDHMDVHGRFEPISAELGIVIV